MTCRTAALVTTGAFVLSAPLALTACGGGSAGSGDDAGRAATTTTGTGAPRYLDRHALALAVGNGFRVRLDQLAVMQQPPEGAADLGQDLPAGLVRDVACAPTAARPAAGRPWPWRCRVRWETVAGAPKATTYHVRSLATGCFAAGAVPQLADIKDPTINTFAEHPLNTVVSARKGC